MGIFSDVAELINCSALLRVRVASAKLNIQSWTNPSSTSESSTAKKYFAKQSTSAYEHLVELLVEDGGLQPFCSFRKNASVNQNDTFYIMGIGFTI